VTLELIHSSATASEELSSFADAPVAGKLKRLKRRAWAAPALALQVQVQVQVQWGRGERGGGHDDGILAGGARFSSVHSRFWPPGTRPD
jgi:hypothetical protein